MKASRKAKVDPPVRAHITMILDRSGSMHGLASDVIGAVNKFVEDQQKVEGACTFTLVQFDDQDPYETICRVVPIKQAPKLTALTYQPRGNTPLLDAVGRGIADLERRIGAAKKSEAPNKIVFVIETDGLENASKEYTREQIRDTIQSKTKAGWQFVFLGADQDAIAEGKGIGIQQNTSAGWVKTSSSVRNTNAVISAKVAIYRGGPVGQSIMGYTDEEREEMKK